jgi:glycosyltransferase involved in cell wall biosynthesis
MALGKAIVSTKLGAEGLVGSPGAHQAVAGQELLLVEDDDPVAFAGAVVALLRDPAQRVGLGSAARAFVKAHYDWRVIIPRLEALYARR